MALFAGWGIAQNPAPAKKPVSSSKRKAKRKSTAKKPTAAPSQSARARTASKNTKRTQAHRSTQQQPTQERYQQIQQALADRGYFDGPADGRWGPDSVEALRRFQREQNLTDDGKIGSLSLIALGLGPRRPPAESTQDKGNR